MDTKKTLLGEYQFRILPNPEEGVVLDKNPRRNCEKGLFKITGYTFDNIPSKFNIRPNAAIFMKHASKLFVVLYMDENTTECLFAFQFRKYRRWIPQIEEGYYPEMVRCVGKNIVKGHRECVQRYIKEHQDELMQLESDCVLKHYIFTIR